MAAERVRLMRLLIYEGDREWVEKTVAQSIHGRKQVSTGASITAVSLSLFPQVLGDENDYNAACDALDKAGL